MLILNFFKFNPSLRDSKVSFGYFEYCPQNSIKRPLDLMAPGIVTCMGSEKEPGCNYTKHSFRPLFRIWTMYDAPLSKYSKKLDSLQNKCLNALFSTYINTSKSALETLTHLPNMSHRWKTRILTRDQGHIATIARDRTRRHLKRRSCFAMMDMHPFDEKWNSWIDEDPQNKRKITPFIIEQRKEYIAIGVGNIDRSY